MAGGQTNACLPPFLILFYGRMVNRYYKQADPSTPLYLSNGQTLVFPSVDGETGYLITSDDFLVRELNTAINKFVGGVAVCTAKEYKEYLKKKSSGQTPAKKWREEIKAEISSDPAKSPLGVAPPAGNPGSGSIEAQAADPIQRVGKFKASK